LKPEIEESNIKLLDLYAPWPLPSQDVFLKSTYRGRDVGIQREKISDGLEERRNAMAVCPHQLWTMLTNGGTWKIGIRQN
jgi:hypothetical protein